MDGIEKESGVYSLRSNTAPPFAVTLRITPELQQDLIRAQQSGKTSSIAFSSSKDSRNVISVNGKEFHFTSFEESYCDVYSKGCEQELHEVGQVLRKCQVQRKLNQSEASRVKQRCAESELMKNARTSKSLNHTQIEMLNANPPRVSTVKQVISRKIESVSLPSRPVTLPKNIGELQRQNRPSGLLRTSSVNPVTNSKVPVLTQARSVSPALFQEQRKLPLRDSCERPSSSPPVLPTNAVAGPITTQKVITEQAKEQAKLERELTICRASRAADSYIAAGKCGLRAALIVLLTARPLSLKAVRMALSELDFKSNSRSVESKKSVLERSEKVLQEVANFQAPGRYYISEKAKKELVDIENAIEGQTGITSSPPGAPVTPQPPEEQLKVVSPGATTTSTSPKEHQHLVSPLASVIQSAPPSSSSSFFKQTSQVREAPTPALSKEVPVSARPRAREPSLTTIPTLTAPSLLCSSESPLPSSSSAPPPSHTPLECLTSKVPKKHERRREKTNGFKLVQEGPGIKRSREDIDVLNDLLQFENTPPICIEPISTIQQYNEYHATYTQKYPVYCKQYAVLDQHAKIFRDLDKKLHAAECGDRKAIVEQEIRNQLRKQGKSIARLDRAHQGLHEELKLIKQAIKKYNEVY